MLRFQYPYRSAGKKAPDRPAVLFEATRRAAAELARRTKLPPERLVLGGRSMGGRYCSMVAAGGMPNDVETPVPCLGLLLLGYPLHAAGKPEKERSEHFPRLTMPVLFVSGTRDSLAAKPALVKAARKVKGPREFHWIETGDHGFKPLKSSGLTVDGVLADVADAATRWVLGLARIACWAVADTITQPTSAPTMDPAIAPTIAPAETPVESPSRPVTDDGDHDRFAHYARKDDVDAGLRDRRSDRGALRQEVGADPRSEGLPDLSDVQGTKRSRLESLTCACRARSRSWTSRDSRSSPICTATTRPSPCSPSSARSCARRHPTSACASPSGWGTARCSCPSTPRRWSRPRSRSPITLPTPDCCRCAPGLAAGNVILFEGDDYTGGAVNLAARLCDLAQPLEVLATADVG